MAQSEQQRQRKLAKKQAKNREKHKLITRKQQELASLAGKMQASAGGAIVHCGVCDSIAETGLGHVFIARQGPSRQVAVVGFLVDASCLGVKDLFADLRGPAEAKELIKEMEIERGLKSVAPELARGLVEASIEYAKSLGFEPHADYRKVAAIWGDIEAESIVGQYEFGREGKPFYANGPYEDAAKQQLILRTLERNVGAGNFDFMLGRVAGGNFIASPYYAVNSDDDDDDYFDPKEPDEDTFYLEDAGASNSRQQSH